MSKSILSLKPGSKVSYQGEEWFIECPEDFERVLASKISDGRREFLPISELSPTISVTEASQDQQFSVQGSHKPVLTESSKLEESPELNRHMDLFRELVALSKLPKGRRRESVRSLAKSFDISEPSVYRKLSAIENGASADDLHRAIRSDKKGVGTRVGQERFDIVEQVLRERHFVATPSTVEDCVDVINSRLRRADLKEVSRSFVYQVRNKVTYKNRLIAQGRKKEVRDTFRPSVSHLPDNDYPLGTIQVDHTPCQICFVDEASREPIGDAWLTLVIDCYSRMVLGFYLSFGGPSTLSTGLALARAFLPKDTLLRKLNVKGTWPCWGFPDIILVDNAAELNGRMMQSARNYYRFTIRNRPIGFPQFGGHVESAFKTFMHEIKTVGGTKFSNPVERAEYDSEGRSILTLREFEWYFTEFLVNDYHLAEHRGDGMNRRAPIQRWNAGIFEGDVFPPVGVPDIPADPQALQISFMPVEWRVITKATISLFDETYYSGALASLADSIDPTQPREQRKFEVRYDPRDISKIWVRDPVADVYIEATFADLRKPSISLWEHRARKRALGRPADIFKDHRADSKERRDAFKSEKARVTKQARREAERIRRDAAESITKPATPMRPVQPAAPPTIQRSKAEIIEEMRRRMGS